MDVILYQGRVSAEVEVQEITYAWDAEKKARNIALYVVIGWTP